MTVAFIRVNGKLEAIDVSQATYERLRKESWFRKCPIQRLLYQTAKKYGSLTEKNIIKFINKK